MPSPPKARPIRSARSGVVLPLEPLLPVPVGGGVRDWTGVPVSPPKDSNGVFVGVAVAVFVGVAVAVVVGVAVAVVVGVGV